MTPATTALVALACGTYALKAFGPLVAGGRRELPKWLTWATALLPAALLAALAATGSLTADGTFVLDARLAGVVVAAIALRLRAPFVVVVLAAAAATGAVRALG